MARMLIWNAVSARRRSATDNIMENGLAQLRGAAEKSGHELTLVDWAREGFHASLAPRWLTRLCRAFLARAMAARENGSDARARMWWALSMPLQGLQTAVRRARMRARLRKLARRIVGDRFRLVGVKVWYGEALAWSELLMRYVRALDPSVVFVAGGPLVSIYGEPLLRDTDFDIAVAAQGEEALVAILDAADDHEGSWDGAAVVEDLGLRARAGYLRNVWYRSGGRVLASARCGIDASEGIPPVYLPEDIEGKCRIHVVKSSLGCSWGKCSFCVHPRIYPGYHPRPIDEIVSEMKTMAGRGVGLFRFAGSDTPPAFAVEIVEWLISEGIHVEFGMGLRGVQGILDPGTYRAVVRQFERLVSGGLRSVIMGGETGHPDVNRDVMNKGLRPGEIERTIDALREAAAGLGEKVDVALALIHPTPLVEGVSPDDVYEATVDMVGRIRPDAVAVNPPAPFPGTEWEKNRERYGFEIADGVEKTAMRYEFVPYKPPSAWPDVGVRMNGLSWKEMLRECGRMRRAVEEMDLSTDLTDEHFTMMKAAGETDVRRYKKQSLLDILSGSYEYIDRCQRMVNEESEALADRNLLWEEIAERLRHEEESGESRSEAGTRVLGRR